MRAIHLHGVFYPCKKADARMTSARMLQAPSHVFLPGETVFQLEPTDTVMLGEGLYHVPSADPFQHVVVATRCGRLCQSNSSGSPAKYSIPSHSAHRYHPRLHDPVIGSVTRLAGQQYVLDIGATLPVFLDILSFDGATKHHRPKLIVGDLVYCHISRCDSVNDADVDVSCAMGDMGITAKEWTTGESLFGPLPQTTGMIVTVPLHYAAELLSGKAPVLLLLGERVAFEVVIGLNGRVWVSASVTLKRSDAVLVQRKEAWRRTIAISDCLLQAQMDRSPVECFERVCKTFPSITPSAASPPVPHEDVT